MTDMRCWVIVASKDHVQNGVRQGITQANHGKSGPLKRMQIGDVVLYYSPKVEYESNEKLQAFTALGRVTGDKIYQFDMGGGFVPYRRDVEYFDCVETPIQPLVANLTFIRNKQSWGYLFRFGFFEIPKADFDLIASKMLTEKLIHA